MSIYYGVSADGRSVAEAEVGGVTGARELLAAAAAEGCELAWAHSAADLSSLGFRERPGYRRLVAPARPAPAPEGVTEVPAEEDTAELCAAAYCGQWGHKTPGTWPVAELAGSRLLGLRRDGLIAGICRVFPAAGSIDAPGLIFGERDEAGYRMLMAAGAVADHGRVGDRGVVGGRAGPGQCLRAAWPGNRRVLPRLGDGPRPAVPVGSISLTRRTTDHADTAAPARARVAARDAQAPSR